MKKRIIFIEYGASQRYSNQVKYSVMTLQAHNQLDSSEIVIYTETPERYSNLAVSTRSIKEKVFEYSLGGKYHFRIKPRVLLDAIEEHQCKVLFLDTDTFCNASLMERINSIDEKNILMNVFEKANPYPDFILKNIPLPSGLIYSYNEKKSKMYNSGVIGIDPSHQKAIKDAIALIDVMQAQGLKYHTAEQTALSESFRIHNIHIHEVNKEITHYTRGTGKDFMDNEIQKELANLPTDSPYPANKFIALGWFKPRLHKILKKITR